MEQKTKITSLQELIDWFNDIDSCYISEQYDEITSRLFNLSQC
jgi:hypothetical protein